jgi:hypothetical protein
MTLGRLILLMLLFGATAVWADDGGYGDGCTPVEMVDRLKPTSPATKA